jgi:hypothetical protein
MSEHDPLVELRQLVTRRDRLSAALEQAQFDLERAARDLKEAGVDESAISTALGDEPIRRKPKPRLVMAKFPPREAQPPRMDGRAEGFWSDE